MMNIFLLLALTMLLIILLMRRHIYTGLCMLAGGLLLWASRSLEPLLLWDSLVTTALTPRSYDLIGALYLVMCLEIELRTSGTLAGMVQALQKRFSRKATLAVMPAFLGLLPSLGGARFSAPIVEEAGRDMELTKEEKAGINFWFRHPFEFSNPIIAGMIMACSIAGVKYAEFVQYTAWMSVVCIVVGWFVLIRPIRFKPGAAAEDEVRGEGGLLDIVLSLSPIFITFLLVVLLDFNASVAMAIAVAAVFIILRSLGRSVSLREVILGAVDKKMFINVSCILYFVQLLNDTGVLREIVEAFQAAPLPVPVIIACISFVVGMLTGMSQAHVAIVMPIVAAISTGDMTLAAVAMIFGVGGQMLTPTHVCFTVTTDFFDADFFQVLKKMALIEAIVLTIFSVVTYLGY